MKNRTLVSFLIFAVLVLATSACVSGQAPISTDFFTPANGKDTRILTIKSDRFWGEDQQKEVLPKFLEALDSGLYNVTSITTSYSNEYLVSADIYYDSASQGEGNKIRVIYVGSKHFDANDKEKDVSDQINLLVNNGGNDIVKVQYITYLGKNVAALVFFKAE